MPNRLRRSPRIVRSPDEERIERERIHDVLLLLDNLVLQEKATISLIIDCLYDVGAVNIANGKVRVRSLNRLSKAIARFSKPMFRMIAWYWFRKNCPTLIANWLHAKVKFEPPKEEFFEELDSQLAEVEVLPSMLPTEAGSAEVRQLKAQVRLLTGLLIGAIALLGSTLLWLGYNQMPELLELNEQVSLPFFSSRESQEPDSP